MAAIARGGDERAAADAGPPPLRGGDRAHRRGRRARRPGINLAFRQSFLTAKTGDPAFWAFIAFYVVCIVVTYVVYLRPAPLDVAHPRAAYARCSTSPEDTRRNTADPADTGRPPGGGASWSAVRPVPAGAGVRRECLRPATTSVHLRNGRGDGSRMTRSSSAAPAIGPALAGFTVGVTAAAGRRSSGACSNDAARSSCTGPRSASSRSPTTPTCSPPPKSARRAAAGRHGGHHRHRVPRLGRGGRGLGARDGPAGRPGGSGTLIARGPKARGAIRRRV